MHSLISSDTLPFKAQETIDWIEQGILKIAKSLNRDWRGTLNTTTLLPWVVTRKVGDDDRPLASFALRNDAEYYLKNPKYTGKGKLKITFNPQDGDIVIDQSIYYAKITNPREFQGFVIAERVEMNPKSHRYEGFVHNPLTKKTHKHKLHEDFPDTLLGYKVIWLIGEP